MGRALSHDAQLIVMDEPSAVLAHDEVANLFRVIRELTSRGIAVIYISHRLEEIREIGDRVTVLKDGRTSAVNLPARTTRTDELVTRMTGRTIEYVFPQRTEQRESAERAAAARGYRADPAGGVRRRVPVVRAGEIVGIAGLGGLRALGVAGDHLRRPPARDAARCAWTAAGSPPGRVSSAVRAGIGLAPEERKSQALMLEDRIYRNVTLATFSRYASAGITRASAERAAAAGIADLLALHPRGVDRPVKTLSGGNQQKVVLGRWLLDPSNRRPPGRRAAATARAAPGCCCSTSRPAGWTSAPERTCTASSAGWLMTAWACSWSPARCPRCWAWPTG